MPLNSSIKLVLGGARSGKSRYAESLVSDIAKETNKNVCYLATAQAFDDEMRARIDQHKLDRPNNWATVEVPLLLGEAIREADARGEIMLVDCLTLWMMSVLEDKDPLTHHVSDLISAIEDSKEPIVMVSNEISMGVVPMGELSRQFVDELGRLHQRVAHMANTVTLMVAGIPHPIKS